jgi:hypothetical protein
MKSVLRGLCLLALASSTVACSGGGNSASSVIRENADSGLAPEQNGFYSTPTTWCRCSGRKHVSMRTRRLVYPQQKQHRGHVW